jgi:hypothetical protein
MVSVKGAVKTDIHGKGRMQVASDRSDTWKLIWKKAYTNTGEWKKTQKV